MKDLEVGGIALRVTKYKVMIFDERDEVTPEIAEAIAIYIKEEGFIEKDEFPIEIIKPE
tara:strand:- start:2668 stop:2844 length:177 start_codon:yes stop_codon:yes gene_type:complete